MFETQGVIGELRATGQLADISQPTDPRGPADTGQPVGPGQPADASEPADPGGPADADQLGGAGQPGGPGQPNAAGGPGDPGGPGDGGGPVAVLEAAICELAGHLAAATCRFLVLLGEFDAREGWSGWDMPSCAAWLSWKCQMGSSTAREHVRVARALRGLPVIRAGFAAGRLSYSKVRALTRIADPGSDADLAGMAAPMTANQLDRFARAHRTVTGAEAAGTRLRRRLIWRYEDDGSLVLTARLPPEDGAAVLTALRAVLHDTTGTGEPRPGPGHGQGGGEAGQAGAPAEARCPGDPAQATAADAPAEARDRGRTGTAASGHAPAEARRPRDPAQATPKDAPAGTRAGNAPGEVCQPDDPRLARSSGAPAEAGQTGASGTELTPGAPAQAQAEHGAPAEAQAGGTSEGAGAGGGPERVLATSASLADALTEIAEAYLTNRASHAANPDAYQVIVHTDATTLAGQPGGRCHIDDGPALSPAALQQIICGAVTRWMSHDHNGLPLNVGRRRRDPTPAIRAALRDRDRCRCRFPGCGRRATQAHHIRWWLYGGITSLDNLISLCRYHHTLIHQHGYTIAVRGPGVFVFLRPDGQPIPPSPPLPEPAGQITDMHDAEITPGTIVPPWYGERLDLDYAIWVAFANQHARQIRDQNQATTAA